MWLVWWCVVGVVSAVVCGGGVVWSMYSFVSDVVSGVVDVCDPWSRCVNVGMV